MNYTNEGKRRIDLVFSAGYNCPIETVKLAIREAVEKFPKVYADPAPFVRASAYKDSVIEYTVRVWCGTDDYWDLYYDIIEAVSESYNRHGVEMSYPHVNVHMVKD